MTVSETIEALRRVAALGAADSDPKVRAVAEQIAAFIDSSEARSLDEALGLRPEPGEAHWRTVMARTTRNIHLRLAASIVHTGVSPREVARTIHRELHRYVDHEWQADRHASDCPPHLRGTIREPLWYALRAWPSLLSVKRIEEIIAGNTVAKDPAHVPPPHAA